MALKELYIGSQGPLLYDDASPAGMSEKQVATKEDVADSQLPENLQGIVEALGALTSAGILVRLSNGSYAVRSIEGTSGEVDVLAPSGQTGNMKIGLPSAVTVTSLTTQGLHINITVYAATGGPTHKIPITVNGSPYFLLLQQ
jgi:predicted transcriptional regulator of viral defense system